MFLRNAWYVAAWDHEVTAEKPFGRILLNEPVVLYRTKAAPRVNVVADSGQVHGIRLLRRLIEEEAGVQSARMSSA